MVKAIEVEVDGPHNESLAFRPLQRSVRGRFDMMRVGEPMAKVKANEWPLPIPSQRIGIDSEGNGYLLEPLHDDEHAPTREKIEAQGMKLEPARQSFESVDIATWTYWLQRAVESGLGKVTKGELPAKIDGKVRKNFILNEPEESTTDRLTAALDRQSAAFEKLADAMLRMTHA